MPGGRCTFWFTCLGVGRAGHIPENRQAGTCLHVRFAGLTAYRIYRATNRRYDLSVATACQEVLYSQSEKLVEITVANNYNCIVSATSHQNNCRLSRLSVLLLMTILTQALFAFVRCDLMAFALFSTRHN